MCESITSLFALFDSYVRQECMKRDWRDSLVVSAVAMALPHTSVCIPNAKPFDLPHAWTQGTLARNALYGWIYTHLGTDFTRWFERMHISQDTTKQIMQVVTGLLFLFTENNVELLIKRILGILLRQVIQ
jgi:hypothetical protein